MHGHNAGPNPSGEAMAVSLDEFTERRAYNAVSDFVDTNVARGRGGKIAFVDEKRKLTYGELQKETARLAGACSLSTEARKPDRTPTPG